MNTKRKFYLTILMLVAGTFATRAQNAIAVYQKDGTVAKFAFTEKPVVTYSGSDLVMTTSKTSVQYPIYLLQKIGFDVDDIINTVDEVKLPQTQFSIRDGILTVRGGEAGSAVSLYTFNGMMVGQYRLDSDGCATIPLQSLGKSLYIVKNKQFSFKFRRP